MNIDFDALHAAARRERALALERFLYAPVGAWFRKLLHVPPRRPAAAFPTLRGC